MRAPAPAAPPGLPGFLAGRGYLGWWVAGAVACVAFSRVAFFNPVLGVFVDPLEQTFGWSRTEIAGALSVGTIAGAMVAPFIGHYVDRWGGRRFMVAGTLVLGGLLLLLAFIEELWQFYILFGAGRAIGAGILDIAILVTIANWFIRRRGRAMGLMMVGTRGAIALMPLIVLLFISLADWRAAFAALGVLVLLFAVGPSYLLVRRRPEDVGLLPDGESRGGSAAKKPVADDPRWSVRQVLRTRAFWLLLLGSSNLVFVGGATNFSMVSHLQDNGLSPAAAISVITVWAIVGMVGGVVGGELRERLEVRVALPLAAVASCLGLALLIAIDNLWMAYLFAIWHGFAFGAQLPLHQIIFADYFGRWSVGAIRGLSAPIRMGTNAAGPVVAGLVFDARGSYDLIYAVFIGLLLLAAALIFSARPPSARPDPAAKSETPRRPA